MHTFPPYLGYNRKIRLPCLNAERDTSRRRAGADIPLVSVNICANSLKNDICISANLLKAGAEAQKHAGRGESEGFDIAVERP